MVMNGAQCKNCLRVGHTMSKCHATPMCKMCHKYHHTLLHKETDTKTDEMKKLSSSSYAASSRQNEEVLLRM